MELTRGTIADRPWAQTLSALSRRGFTGQLALVGDDGKQFAIAFERGMAVGAISPLPNDLIVRIALTNHFIGATQVSQLARTIAASPERDEIDVVVEMSRLTAEQEIVLRERAILQRAARTFSIDSGTFILDDTVTIATSPCIVDPLRIIYFGVRMNLSEQRLLHDLRYMGTFFEVGPKAQDELMRYGFGKDEQPIVEAVRSGTSVPALEVSHRELDPRTVQAVLFTLAACGTAVGTTPSHLEMPLPPAKFAAASAPSVQRIQSSSPLVVKATPDQVAVARTASQAASEEWRSMGTPGLTRSGIGLRPVPPAPAKPLATTRPGGTSPPPSEPGNRTAVRPTRPPPSESGTRTRAPSASPPRSTPPTSPPRSESGVRINPLLGQRTTGSLPALPGEEPIDLELDFAAEITAGPPPVEDPQAAAAAAFKRGEAAIASESLETAIAELTRATQLQPGNHDYAAMLAWAKFCKATDKNAAAETARKVLVHAILKVDEPVLAEFLLGRVERMLGRDREALAHFRRVLELRPRHPGAAAEIRVIELRLASQPRPGGSLFGRK